MTDEVVDLGKKRVEKKKSQATQEAKLGFAEVCDAYSEIIDGRESFIAEFVSKSFPNKFYGVETTTPGQRVILEECGDRIVRYSTLQAVTNAISQFGPACRMIPEFMLSPRKAKECAEHWLSVTKTINEPKLFAWKDDPQLTFSRLPWSYAPDDTPGRCPTWESIFKRMANYKALCAWIGSLFVDDSDMQQYVWLYGVGADGKGAVNRFLAKALGPAYQAKHPPARSDKHWTANLRGIRLAVFPDCNDQNFVASGLFKALSGGDPVPVEEKYRPSYSLALKAKYLFLSNEQPKISSEHADMRRIIYCPMEPRLTADDPDFEQKLWHEGGTFISNCIAYYRTVCPTDRAIPQEREHIRAWVSSVEEDYEEFTKTHLDPTAYEGALASAPFTPAGDLYLLVSDAFPKRHERTHYLAWLKASFGIRRVNLTHGDRRTSDARYVGVVLSDYGTRRLGVIRREIEARAITVA